MDPNQRVSSDRSNNITFSASSSSTGKRKRQEEDDGNQVLVIKVVNDQTKKKLKSSNNQHKLTELAASNANVNEKQRLMVDNDVSYISINIVIGRVQQTTDDTLTDNDKEDVVE